MHSVIAFLMFALPFAGWYVANAIGAPWWVALIVWWILMRAVLSGFILDHHGRLHGAE